MAFIRDGKELKHMLCRTLSASKRVLNKHKNAKDDSLWGFRTFKTTPKTPREF